VERGEISRFGEALEEGDEDVEGEGSLLKRRGKGGKISPRVHYCYWNRFPLRSERDTEGK
jgi:hypothetical protein